jgi:hypothetical protein
MALAAMAALVYGVMYIYFKSENKKRLAGKRDSVKEGLMHEEVVALGDENPGFIFAA